jgi:hypothetical protein
MNAKRDEPLEEIWAIRRRIAARFGFDPHKQAEHLRQRQALAKDRLYHREQEFAVASEVLALRHAPPSQK